MFLNLSDRTLLIAGAFLVVIAAWCTIGYHNPDEHTQIWEFANYKLGYTSVQDLSWEFPAKMRPGLQPFIAYCSVLGASAMGITSPFVQTFLLRLLSGAAALFVYWKWTVWLERDLKNPVSARWMRIGLLFFWLMPYLNARFTSENTSAICFFGGLLLVVQELENQNNRFSAKLVLAGLLLGLSFFFRYQIAFAGIGLFAWLLFQNRLTYPKWGGLICGVFLAVGIGLATDYWLYGEWVFAPYNYYFYNILEGKAAGFGVWPFWWYFTEMPIALVPPLSIVLMVFMAIGIWRHSRHPLTWCLIPFVLAHSIIAHKEVRFMYTMALPFFFLSAAGWQYFQEKYTVKKWMVKSFFFLIWLNLVMMVFRIFIPAKDVVTYAQFLWYWHGKHPNSTVYFVKEEPKKHYPLPISFYENPAQTQRSWYTLPKYKNDTTALRPGDLMVFTEAAKSPPAPPPGFRMEREFSYYPEWILKVNINNWQSRTLIWEIYRLEYADK
ncbi:MAG: hypothetical protein ACKVU0_18435 [Saprospiraceae bacterium]